MSAEDWLHWSPVCTYALTEHNFILLHIARSIVSTLSGAENEVGSSTRGLSFYMNNISLIDGALRLSDCELNKDFITGNPS
jgi:hypothetical protein